MLIRPKEGILDPQGKAVERALPALGFEGVSHVHVGRLVELEYLVAHRAQRGSGLLYELVYDGADIRATRPVLRRRG